MAAQDNEVTVDRLLTVKTFGVRGQPRAVLEITLAEGDTLRLMVGLADLAALGQRLSADAQLLRAALDGGGARPS